MLGVSIVTPSFNPGPFLRETIASVLDQDYPHVEYLVMDGGSTDGTLELLRGYGDRLRWLSEPDDGQTVAINRGWRLTGGEIVAWLNADDTYRPGAVRAVADYFAAHPAVDVLYGDCDYTDACGRTVERYPTRPFSYRELVRSTINYLPQPATFIRRRAVEAVGSLDESLHYVMDFEYWLRLGMQHRIAYLPACLATLRLHAGAKSVHAVERFGPELIRVYQHLFASPRLPARVRAIERQAMSNVYYRAASIALWSGHARQARAYALRAWRYAPLNVRPPLLLSLFGDASARLLARWRTNPYQRGVAP
jgi:glycosyltransferase involved in cell wall biosynthesis